MKKRPLVQNHGQGGVCVGWLSFGLWGLLTLYGLRQPKRRKTVRRALTAGLAVSMAGQEVLLVQDGLWSLQTGLPLHLCGMMGLCSLPLLWLRPRGLLCFSLLLGAPCALLALCFPAVIGCSRPFLMGLHFGRLHGLIVWSAVFALGENPKPLTLWEARKTILWASGYAWLVQLCNEWLPANYLFLRAVPTGTPLEWLAQRGWGYYLCSLWLLAMVCLRWGRDFWNALLPRLTALTAAGNRSAYSRCTRSTSPCTNPDRGS